ncbi:MAG: Rne/Rng family ribonuclease [Myxococcota bacterium]|nr:Rne/Rng family ribonuclease [Myxococcota bacterium]
MSTSSLVINVSPCETRVALVEAGQPVEVHLERELVQSMVGNIYKARVARVLPGMQAAFVNIGHERNGFLFVDDAVTLGQGTEDLGPNCKDYGRESNEEGESPKKDLRIADLVKANEEILVQVKKDPLGTKGPRVTRQLTIPGRFIVLMCETNHLGISQRIVDVEERERLRGILESIRVEGVGFIARTAAEGASLDDLSSEAESLITCWRGIEKCISKAACPSLLYSDLSLEIRIVRDLFSDDVGDIYVDDFSSFQQVKSFIRGFAPHREKSVQLFEGTEPIFDRFGIEVELSRALQRVVWLKSGGSLVIDEAEALTVVDVNSGRYVGTTNLEDTITHTNLEAVREIAHQVRLRNLGGIIIVDFIDMSKVENQEKVYNALEEAMSYDRSKIKIVRMSELGLVEMTRKRVRPSLNRMLLDHCPYCRGSGDIKSTETIANEVLRRIDVELRRKIARSFLVNLHPDVANFIFDNQSESLESLEVKWDTTIYPISRRDYHRESYDFVRGSMES